MRVGDTKDEFHLEELELAYVSYPREVEVPPQFLLLYLLNASWHSKLINIHFSF